MIGAGGVGNPWPLEKRGFVRNGGDDVGEGDVEDKKGEKSGLAASPDLDEGSQSRAREAMKTLESHVRNRTPYVQLSSKRMQAVMGLRNELAFGLSSLLFYFLFSYGSMVECWRLVKKERADLV